MFGHLQPCGIRLLARERDQPLDVIDSAAREQSAAMRKKKSQERKPGNANAGRPDRHETAHAELTGAGGSHSSSTCRVRHCWLADVALHQHSFGIIMLSLGLLATT